jgi:hypothetical protein
MHGPLQKTVAKYDKALKEADSSKYKLSIQSSLDGFSFVLFDENTKKFQSVESISLPNLRNADEFGDTFEKYAENHSWLNLPYKQVSIIHECTQSTLVPSPLFDPQELNNYTNLNFVVSENEVVKADKLPNVDAYKIYGIPKVIIDTFLRQYPDHRLFCHASILIESLLVLNKNSPAIMRCYVNVRNSYLDIVILEGRQLLFYNSFEYKSIEDFIYYLIFVLEQLKLNPEEIELGLAGYIEKNSKLFEIVYKYIRNISFLPQNDSYEYSYIFQEVPSHRYFNLLSLNQCEL